MRKILPVPYIDQSEKWPTGCESVSAVMLLRFLGFDIDVDTFIQRYLPMAPMEKAEDLFTVLWGTGPDPNRFFCGSPYDPDGFGCYAGVIEASLNNIFREMQPSKGDAGPAETGITQNTPGGAMPVYTAENATGRSTEELLLEIDEGRPVVYWATIDLMPHRDGPMWARSDNGELFVWKSNEHCMLLTGYDTERDTLVFNDPWNNHGVVDYDRKLVEKRHAEMDRMACIVQ